MARRHQERLRRATWRRNWAAENNRQRIEASAVERLIYQRKSRKAIEICGERNGVAGKCQKHRRRKGAESMKPGGISGNYK